MGKTASFKQGNVSSSIHLLIILAWPPTMIAVQLIYKHTVRERWFLRDSFWLLNPSAVVFTLA
jgi:hypothetical protein